MSADNERYFFAETLGSTQIKSVDSVSGVNFELEPGRYLVRYRNIAGAAVLWFSQRSPDESAVLAKAAPNAPFDLAGSGVLFITQVPRLMPSIGEQVKARSRISCITDAGTVDVVVTKISQGAG